MPGNPKVALYAGSFDPITKGHLDVIGKAIETFDIVHIAIGRHPTKRRLFDDRDALNLIGSSMSEHFGFAGDWHGPIDIDSGNITAVNPNVPDIILGSYRGTIIDYAKTIGATHVVRGLRQLGDFNDEFTLTGVAGHLDSNLIFTHFICREEYLHISSSTARELATFGSDIKWLVTPSVADALKKATERNRVSA